MKCKNANRTDHIGDVKANKSDNLSVEHRCITSIGPFTECRVV